MEEKDQNRFLSTRKSLSAVDRSQDDVPPIAPTDRGLRPKMNQTNFPLVKHDKRLAQVNARQQGNVLLTHSASNRRIAQGFTSDVTL